MNDYIKRSDIGIGKCNPDVFENRAYAHGWNAAVEIIEKTPAADVRENVHAHWIDTGSGEECSVCKEIQYGYDTGRRFCPNCGAIMDEEADR